MRYFIYLFLAFFIINNSLNAQVTVKKMTRYNLAEQMLLANEINESGEPFAEALGYDLDELDPFVTNSPDSISYTLGIDNYEYSRYQLGTIISRSGMGLHMMWAPMIMKMAAMEPEGFDGSMNGTPNGFKEDDELIKNIMHFSMLANHAPPGNPWPQFADFMSGDPRLPQTIDPVNFTWADFSTLRWDRSKMDKILSPSSMGQSMMKQYLWAQDMLGAFHDSNDEGIEPDGSISPDFNDNSHFDPNNNVYYGGDGLDGFIGMVLTAETINKTLFVTNKLAYNGTSLGAIDLMNYDPMNGIQYFPHKIQVTEQKMHPMLPPKAASLQVVDDASFLFDQVSYLWAALSFTNMMDPNNNSSSAHYAYHEVFDGDPFPAAMSQSGMPGPFDLMKGTSKAIFLNVLAMHFDPANATFVDEARLNGGVVMRGNTISTVSAAYLIVALQRFTEEFAGTPLQAAAVRVLTQQANFLLSHLHAGAGGFYDAFTLKGKGGRGMAKGRTVSGQAAALRALYAAYQVTGKSRFLLAADAAFDYLIQNYYAASDHAFRTELNDNEAHYTPFNFALIAGALREATLVGGHDEAASIYTRFFTKIGNKMQLSEGEATGESGSDSDGDGIPFIPEQPDNLPPVFASEAVYAIGSDAPADAENSTQRRAPFARLRNFPNPFNPATTIAFSLNSQQKVSLKVFDVTGRQVAQLVNSELDPGEHRIRFNASHLASGVYIYQLKAGKLIINKKIILAR